MNSKAALYKFSILLLSLSVLFVAGCAKPPTQEIAKAEKALDEAKQKEAHLYVPDIYQRQRNR